MKTEDLVHLVNEAQVLITGCQDLSALEALRISFLGKKSAFTALLKTVGQLPPSDRAILGQQVNEAKTSIHQWLSEKKHALETLALEKAIQSNTVEVTLPGRKKGNGSLHPLMQTWYELECLFMSMGFDVILHSPEIEDEYHNFEALNIPEAHPARDSHDTFYLTTGALLRTHTSPVQIRVMESQTPPLRLITPGRVYRSDTPDQTHSPMFTQLEGLWIDESVTFSELKGILRVFLEAFFNQSLDIRFRPSYFPFTEPSAEVDIRFKNHQGHLEWLEVLGCGMVHPTVLEHASIDSERFQGFAFGMGVERLAMLKHGISDLRLFFENDLRFLEQFIS